MNSEQLQDLHRKVFKLFNYKHDIKNYQIIEDWRSHADAVNESKEFTDDCDGFAMTMCELLIEAGVPKEDVMFIVCETETGESHAAAGCTIDGETYVTENRYKQIYNWNDRKGYKWKYFMKFSEPGQWYKVD